MLVFKMDRNLLERAIAETLEILLRDPNFESSQRQTWMIGWRRK
jgi:hypothetical protein